MDKKSTAKKVDQKPKNNLNKSSIKEEVKKIDSPTEIPSQLKVENFPSRNELIQKVDQILSDSGKSSDCYKCSNGSNKITFTFKDSDISFNLVKELNLLKATNSLYSKMKISLEFNNRTANISPLSKVESRYMEAYMETDPNENKRTKKKKKIDIKMYPTLRSTSIFNNCPYIEQSKLDYQDHLKNKMKWINSKGFNVKTKIQDMIIENEIGNISLTEKYKAFKPSFRTVEKQKWTNEKGFNYKHCAENYCEINVLDKKTEKELKRSQELNKSMKEKSREKNPKSAKVKNKENITKETKEPAAVQKTQTKEKTKTTNDKANDAKSKAPVTNKKGPIKK